METIMANGRMGTFNLERNVGSNSWQIPSSSCGFSIYRKPHFGFAFNAKKENRVWVLSVRTPSCRIVNALPKKETENPLIGGEFLEKEFKFEPTFDEYLKVMETVRVGRDKSLTPDDNGYHSENKPLGEDIAEAPASAGLGEDAGLCGPGLNSHRVKNVNSVERGKGGKNVNIFYSDGTIHQANELSGNDKVGRHQVRNGGNKISGGDKTGFRESKAALKSDKMQGLHKKYNDIKGEVNGGDLEKRVMGNDATYSKVGKELQQKGAWKNDKVSRNFDIENRGRGNGYSRTEEPRSYNHSREMQKEQLKQNKIWAKGNVGNVETKMDGSGLIKGMPQKEKLLRTNFASKMGVSEINESTLQGESFNKMNTQGNTSKPGTEINKYKVISHRRLDGGNLERISIDKQRVAYDIEINDEEQSTNADDIGKDFRKRYRSQSYVRFHGDLTEDSVEVKKLGSSGTEIPEGLRKKWVHEAKGGGYNISLEDEKLRGPSPVFKEGENANDFDMDRKAFKSFEVFTDVRGRPRVLRMEMEERIQKLAKWLNGTDVDMPEWQFSKMMHSAKIRFTDHTILRVVQILGSLGNWRRVLQVVQWLQSRDRFKSYKSRYIYTTVINVLGKAKRPVEALNVFYAMRKEFSSYPDLAAYHCIAVTLGQAGLMKELFDIIDCMRALPPKNFKTGVLEKWDPRLEPDAVVYNAVLNACVQQKQWEGAFWVLQQLKQRWIQPSSTTYGLVMEVMLVCGKYSLVHEFFRKVEKTSVPNTLNYKVLVNAFWREGKTDEAVLVVQDMERRGIVGSASLYYDLARCLCSAGRCQEALQQMDKICKVAKKPLVVTYTGLIQACLDSGNVQNGAYIFSQMHKFCSPNIVTFNIMIKAYIENKLFEEAKVLFQKILDGAHYISSVSDYKNRVIPDNFMFNTMLAACVEEKRWDDFEKFFRRMLHHGYHFNPKRHLWMILEASRSGKGQSLDTTWHYLIRSGQTAPVAIIKERFCMKLAEDDVTSALSCLASDQMSLPRAFSEKAWLDLFNGNAYRIRKDTLIRLVDEVNTLISKTNDQPNSVYKNLLSSSREFF
ncbi:hypothetical protein AAC387_Pa06g1611 [Persea americana]